MFTLHVNGLALSSYEDGYAVLTIRESTGSCYELRVYKHDSLHLRLERSHGFDFTDKIVLESSRFAEDVESVVFCSSSGKPLFSYHQ